MVAKINTGKSLYGVLAYNQKKIEEEKGKILFTNNIDEPPDGIFNIAKMEQDFKDYLPGKYKTKNDVIHISLNPHPDDRISDDNYIDIANEYMKELGYGDQPYIVFKHEDIDRHHIHIVSLNVDSEGNRINDSFQKKRSKKITNEIENKYGLIKSGKSNQQNQSVDFNTAPDIKQKLSNILKDVNTNYRFQSFNEYKTLLSKFNIKAELLTGEKNGNKYNGIVYMPMDNNGNVVGNAYKSSRIGKFCGYDSILKNIEVSKNKWKVSNNKGILDKKIIGCLHNSKNINAWTKSLNKNNIDVVIRRNDEGRIYGVTFIDYENKVVLNGSRLSKNLSANEISNFFNVTKDNPAKEIAPSKRVLEKDVPAFGNDEQYSNFSEQNSGAGLFDFIFDNNNPENDEYVYTTKRKKKRRYGKEM